jgi:hypothetical protein
MIRELLFEKKQFALIVIEGHQRIDMMFLEQLPDKFPANRAASPGDQNPLACECQNGLLRPISEYAADLLGLAIPCAFDRRAGSLLNDGPRPPGRDESIHHGR